MHKFLVISKDSTEDGLPCHYCNASIQRLEFLGYEFEEQKLKKDERIELYDRLGLMGDDRRVPQNFIQTNDGPLERIGGYKALCLYLDEHGLNVVQHEAHS